MTSARASRSRGESQDNEGTSFISFGDHRYRVVGGHLLAGQWPGNPAVRLSAGGHDQLVCPGNPCRREKSRQTGARARIGSSGSPSLSRLRQFPRPVESRHSIGTCAPRLPAAAGVLASWNGMNSVPRYLRPTAQTVRHSSGTRLTGVRHSPC